MDFQKENETAFLNGNLEEKVYMEQSEGFVIAGQEDKVCKLVKSCQIMSKYDISIIKALARDMLNKTSMGMRIKPTIEHHK